MITNMEMFAAFVVPGPAWDDAVGIREQAGWAHAMFMDALVADGTIVLGGPLDDGASILHLVAAGDEAAARRSLGADPWRRDGLLRIAHLARWHLWLDGRV